MLKDSIKNSKTNPANLYIKSLQSEKSKITMTSKLNVISKIIQKDKKFDEIDWSILNYEMVLDIVESIKKENKAPATINLSIAAIKGVTKNAWKSNLISTDTYLWINEIKEISGQRINKGRSLKTDEIKKLIKACEKDNDTTGQRDAAIIAITYSAGLRREETASLKVNHYNKVDGTIIIAGKGNKERKNKLNKKAQQIINKWIKNQNLRNNYLFPKIINNRCTKMKVKGEKIYRIIKSRSEQAGIEKMTTHDLRRTFATKLIENGEDLFIVQELMGHARIDTTKKYDKRAETFKDKAAESLPF